MPQVDDKQIGVARVYSRALLELAEREGVADRVLEELGELVKLGRSDPRFGNFFVSPLVDADDRKSTIEKLFRGRLHDLLVNALQVMNRKDRLAALGTMAEVYRLDHEELRGRVEVHVTTAVPLTDALRDQLRRKVGEVTGKAADLVERVDNHMIGGVVVKIGDSKLDGTVRRQIDRLRESIHERARQELYKSRLAEAAGSS